MRDTQKDYVAHKQRPRPSGLTSDLTFKGLLTLHEGSGEQGPEFEGDPQTHTVSEEGGDRKRERLRKGGKISLLCF